MAQRGITELKLPEIVQIIENTIANTLHKQIITFNEKECKKKKEIGIIFVTFQNFLDIITTILERCYLGKNANIEVGGGIIVRKTAKSILVTT